MFQRMQAPWLFSAEYNFSVWPFYCENKTLEKNLKSGIISFPKFTLSATNVKTALSGSYIIPHSDAHPTVKQEENHVLHSRMASSYTPESWGSTWPSVGTACTTLVLTKKIPSLLCCFCKPHLNIWHTQGKGGWENKYEVKKYHRCSSAWTPSPLQPSCSIWPLWPPFFSSLSLHIRQTTPSNLISVATCKGPPQRLPVNRV